MFYCAANKDVPLTAWKLLNFYPVPTPKTKVEAPCAVPCYECNGLGKIPCPEGCTQGQVFCDGECGGKQCCSSWEYCDCDSCMSCGGQGQWDCYNDCTKGFDPCHCTYPASDRDLRHTQVLAIRGDTREAFTTAIKKAKIYYHTPGPKYRLSSPYDVLTADTTYDVPFVVLRAWASFYLLQEENKLKLFWPLYQKMKAEAPKYGWDTYKSLDAEFEKLVPKPKPKKKKPKS